MAGKELRTVWLGSKGYQKTYTDERADNIGSNWWERVNINPTKGINTCSSLFLESADDGLSADEGLYWGSTMGVTFCSGLNIGLCWK